MPHKESQVFEKPDNFNQRIWRFLNEKQYCDLLNTHTLFFARTDKLGKDKLEGKKTKPEIIISKQYREEWGQFLHLNQQQIQNVDSMDIQADNGMLQHTYVNCWHIFDYDSKAVWNHFKKDIAIQSTYIKLRESIVDSRDFFIGKVKYTDTKTDVSNPDLGFFRTFIRKDKNLYEIENELRAIVPYWINENGKPVFLEKENFEVGLQVKVKLDLLVEKVILSSSVDSSFLEKIKAINKANNFTKPVEISQSR